MLGLDQPSPLFSQGNRKPLTNRDPARVIRLHRLLDAPVDRTPDEKLLAFQVFPLESQTRLAGFTGKSPSSTADSSTKPRV